MAFLANVTAHEPQLLPTAPGGKLTCEANIGRESCGNGRTGCDDRLTAAQLDLARALRDLDAESPVSLAALAAMRTATAGNASTACSAST